MPKHNQSDRGATQIKFNHGHTGSTASATNIAFFQPSTFDPYHFWNESQLRSTESTRGNRPVHMQAVPECAILCSKSFLERKADGDENICL